MTSLLPLSALKRLLDSAPDHASGSVCQRCGSALQPDHLHVADIETRRLECTCGACHAVAMMTAGGINAPHPVPRRYIRLPDGAVTDHQWDTLAIPVGIAFFFHNSSLGRNVVSYPGAAGTMESLLSLDACERMLRASPWMRAMAPDVEALLVRRTHDARDCFIVPIDACYELAGRIRRRWTGFGGGPDVRVEIDSFFTALRQKSELATP